MDVSSRCWDTVLMVLMGLMCPPPGEFPGDASESPLQGGGAGLTWLSVYTSKHISLDLEAEMSQTCLSIFARV